MLGIFFFLSFFFLYCFFFFQAEDGIRDLVRSRGLGDVYKRQGPYLVAMPDVVVTKRSSPLSSDLSSMSYGSMSNDSNAFTLSFDAYRASLVGNPDNERCLLYTSDAADERSSVDLGGRRIIKTTKKTEKKKLASVNNK